jgi:hypothetical protein
MRYAEPQRVQAKCSARVIVMRKNWLSSFFGAGGESLISPDHPVTVCRKPLRPSGSPCRAQSHRLEVPLGLELTDAGCDHTVLSALRTRLVQHDAVAQLFDVLLQQFQASGLRKARGRQRTDSTHVLAAMSILNRLELVEESMRTALNSLAEAAPV